jgi:hypothetical protein
MANTAAAAFEILRQSIEPPGYDRNTAAARKDHLISLLRKDFDVIDAFGTGSLPKYTAIRDHADLDIFVELDYAKHIKDRLPSQVLQSVRDCLGRDYTQARKNGQAVTLGYATWPNVDVVPVRRVIDFRSASGQVYYLPNANNESWIVSDPVANETELEQRNQSFGVEFKRIIKMIKWWNWLHGNYLQSYHIERIALDALTGGFSDYPWWASPEKVET